MALYLGMAAVSLVQAEPRAESGAAKLLGMSMLAALALVTADVARQEGRAKAITRVVAGTSLAVAAAAIAGVALALAGVPTPLVGAYGDLLPGAYARAQAGFPHPNLLASFCVFAAGVVGRDEDEEALPRRLRRIVLGALLATVLLTFSRTILAFGLAVLVRWADTRNRRRMATLYAAAAVAAVLALSAFNLKIDPTRPLDARLLDAPGSRAQSFTTALAALKAHPWLGTGPGSSPARKDGVPFDAHCTPLNIAATLGLPALLGFALVPFALWRARATPTDRATWGMLAGLALDGLSQDVEDFRHLWIAFGLADAGRANLTSK
jgi:O-antigen ligase